MHCQSFCDRSRNFASVNSKFLQICKKYLRELIIDLVFNTESVPSNISYRTFKT
jgi:hypothetical protein